jgi:transcriptional regulator with XRE-family HTH domain
MAYATEHIASTLKAAREAKGLSQRALSSATGVPQGQLSRIENGAVDLRLSSLIALARALDLELTLVPRKTVPAVEAVVRSSERETSPSGQNVRRALRELDSMQSAIADFVKVRPALEEFAQFQRQIRDLQNFAKHVAVPDPETLKEASKALRVFRETQDMGAVREALSQLTDLRNTLAHTSAHASQAETVRPAYSLDEDEHA